MQYFSGNNTVPADPTPQPTSYNYTSPEYDRVVSSNQNQSVGIDLNQYSVQAPLPQGPGRIRKIEIQQLDRGYVLQAGCQALAFSDKEELLEKLTEYFNEPDATERKHFQGTLFSNTENSSDADVHTN